RQLRNARAIHDLNQRKIEEALEELSRPVAEAAAVAAPDTELAAGVISDKIARHLKSGAGASEVSHTLHGIVNPFQRAQFLDAQAIMLRGSAYRLYRDFPKAHESYAQGMELLRSIHDGMLRTDRMASCMEGEMALLAEAEGKLDEAGKHYANAVRFFETE